MLTQLQRLFIKLARFLFSKAIYQLRARRRFATAAEKFVIIKCQFNSINLMKKFFISFRQIVGRVRKCLRAVKHNARRFSRRRAK